MSSSFANGLGRSYSITSSARASGTGGASKPNAFGLEVALFRIWSAAGAMS
jgi:hypothetical protein